MSEVHRRAMVARELRDNAAFIEICAEIREQAGELFFNPNSAIEELAEAHSRIRAIETFAAAIQARLDEQAVTDKKAQDRERHD